MSAPQNWLSRIIGQARRRIDRIIPVFERIAERDAIIEAIKEHPNGKALMQDSRLPDSVWIGLGVANAVERQIRRDPSLMTAEPEVQASWAILDELGLPIPDPDV